MKVDGRHRVLMRGSSAKKDDLGTLLVKDLTEVLQGILKLFGKEDSTGCPRKT